MLTHVRTIVVAQPTFIGNIVDVVRVDTTSIRNPRIQENNSILVLCAGCTSAIAAIVAKHSCVSGNINCSASQIPIVTVVVWTEINGLTIPFRVDFKHVAIRQREATIGAGCASRIAIVVQLVSSVVVCPRTTNPSPVTVSRSFINLTSLEPFSHLVVHVLGDVLVVAVKTRNPLVIRRNGNAISGARRERVCQHNNRIRHVLSSNVTAVLVFRQADAELNCLENDISGLVLVSQLIAQIFESLEVFFAVCFIRYRDAAAIGSEQVIFRYFKSIGRFCCAFDILPIIFQICSAFIGKFPLAFVIDAGNVGVFLVGCVDFSGSILSRASGNAVTVQHKVRCMPRNLHIAAISANVVQGINNREIHLAALPDIVGTLFKDGVLCGIFDNEVVPGRLVLFVVVESQRRINSKVLLALPLIGDGYIVTIQQSIQSDRIANIRSQFIAVFRRYCLQTDESGFCSFRSRDFCVVGIRFRSLFPIHYIRRCILSSFIVRVGILIRFMRQVHNIRDSRRGSGIRGVGII